MHGNNAVQEGGEVPGAPPDAVVPAVAHTGPVDVGALAREHAGVVWRFATGMLGDADAAEEVTQDTFLRAHRARDSFRGEASPLTWLLSIARNVCVDRLRRRSPQSVPLDAVPEGALRPAPGDPAGQAVARRVLADGLQHLAAAEREAFVLVDVLGFGGAEAARLLGVPATTLRSRRHRAHAQLVEHILGGDPR